MGYSARYHAASLAAVFLALAVGIVIGAGLGKDVVSGTTESLEESLQEDVEAARERVGELDAELARERDFTAEAYPALVGGVLRGESVALIALGELSDELTDDVEAALAPTGARVVEVAVVRLPPNLAAAEGLRGSPGRLPDDRARAEELGRRVGRELISGGPLLREVKEDLFTRYSGRPGEVDEVVLARQAPQELDPRDEEIAGRYEAGILAGVRDSEARAVGVEQSGSEPSSVELFDSGGISTVDSVDLTSGKVAAVFALRGAEGNFGIKETADRLLPDLLAPAGLRASPGAGKALGAR